MQGVGQLLDQPCGAGFAAWLGGDDFHVKELVLYSWWRVIL